MTINFTIKTRQGMDYSLEFSSEIIPTVGSTVCFGCDTEGGPNGYYFRVEEVIYYPLKRGSLASLNQGSMAIQVILENNHQNLGKLISPQNLLNPGKWEKRPRVA